MKRPGQVVSLALHKGVPASATSRDVATLDRTEVTMSSIPSSPAPHTKWSIPEVYKGIRMRSRLEVRYAKFFDAHRMNWAYEPEGFEIIGTRYLPDFYLPEIKTLVEVKGVLDATDTTKLRALVPVAAKHGILTILAMPGEPVCFRLCRPTPEMEANAQIDEAWSFVCEWDFDPRCDISDDAAMVRCAKCGKWYFIDSSAGWQCTACGAYSGNMTIDLVHPCSSGWTCHDCPDCGAAG